MDENNIMTIKDGDATLPSLTEAPPVAEKQKQSVLDGTVKKKRRRGKSKRKIMKPFVKVPWQDRRKDKTIRNNRYRKIVLAKTHAPFNNNQFLMEIHKPEPENTFQILQTPSARTRDSSFSVDSEDNYFFSLPEDEEEYLTKEFSSVYEDAQSERLSNMSKNELIQEYLLLEAKYENLVKRSERSKNKTMDDEKDSSIDDNEMLVSVRDNGAAERDSSGTSIGSSGVDEASFSDMLQRVKEQDEQIRELTLSNEKLRLENDHLRQRQHDSSSADSESDSSSTTDSESSSSRSASVVDEPIEELNDCPNENHVQANGQIVETEELENPNPMVNGFHSPNN
ncbi:protein HEXIM1 [Manduca sexta]|uniref:Protein HEXIM1 n=1 Tax=Manduca sexta TaxID=7130 RepID=A0A921ZWP2_MANSE|nr:protein HEXIM1 [Manduca sexta]KAG6465481.1 hypothetical protein O3G_MSEX015176 [Manduca sexta]